METEGKKLAGIYGYPPEDIVSELKREGFYIIDLDVPPDPQEIKRAEGLVPENYCVIIKSIIANALLLKDRLEVVVATVGDDKCNGGLFAAKLLKRLLPHVKVIETSNGTKNPLREPLISESSLPLVRKFEEILKYPVGESPSLEGVRRAEADMVFWGVPPADTKILETIDKYGVVCHIYGWTRLVEMGIPGRVDLELEVDMGKPAVIFAHSFCQKTLWARYLARAHPQALYLEISDFATDSEIAKLEAFMELVVCGRGKVCT